MMAVLEFQVGLYPERNVFSVPEFSDVAVSVDHNLISFVVC
jgi:hypothetical protein